MKPDLYFAIPGDPATLTGGYAYDRHLCAGLQALGLKVELLPLSGPFPAPDTSALAAADKALASLPDNALVLIDCLAFGVMDTVARRHYRRLRLLALCHHPLALESGLDRATAQNLHASEQSALALARAVVVNSHSTARVLQTDFAVPAASITVALPGTDKKGTAPCTGVPPVLLTVATLTRRKAHDVLIKALARHRSLPWQARFVGGQYFDPAWVAMLQILVAEHGLQERITFVGEVSDPDPEYRAADLFVLPSLHEGYGMAFAEALAWGLPVLAAHAGAVPDLVPANAGILVPPGDVDALAAALGRLLNEPELRRQLSQGARLAADTLQSWNTTAETVANLIRSFE